MGIWDRFGRGADTPPQPQPAAQPSADEQAIARYRYMLKTAPPEAIEQAHAEAFAALTPEQRRKVLEQLKAEAPEFERAAAARAAESPDSLARLATRAEIRQPGAMERIFGGVGGGAAGAGAGPAAAGVGLGGMLAGSFLASMAGSVLGSMVAQHFFASHPETERLFGAFDTPLDRSGATAFDRRDVALGEPAGDDGALDDGALDDGALDDDLGGLDDGGTFDA